VSKMRKIRTKSAVVVKLKTTMMMRKRLILRKTQLKYKTLNRAVREGNQQNYRTLSAMILLMIQKYVHYWVRKRAIEYSLACVGSLVMRRCELVLKICAQNRKKKLVNIHLQWHLQKASNYQTANKIISTPTLSSLAALVSITIVLT
jgi:hypothetical protein